jgi:hypothetical protein
VAICAARGTFFIIDMTASAGLVSPILTEAAFNFTLCIYVAYFAILQQTLMFLVLKGNIAHLGSCKFDHVTGIGVSD